MARRKYLSARTPCRLFVDWAFSIHCGVALRENFLIAQSLQPISLKKMSTTTLAPKTESLAVSKHLKTLLADSYALMGQTHLAHWNVEGPNFFQLHIAFQAQYEELFTAVDDVAERLRALDVLALGGLATLAKASSITEMTTAAAPAKDYVAHLIDCHEIVVNTARAVRDAAGDTRDLETQDLAIGRIRLHQKTLWMLKSFLKNL